MKVIQTSEPVRVLFHQNGGFTKLVYERYEQGGVTDGPRTFDLPTGEIPENLRTVGSRFLLITEAPIPESSDSLEQIRGASRVVSIKPLT